ncbi:LysR family transcriptional regulator [Kouleothrix aurantiaca]|jgi:LysR family transcriptional activator of nhaA|uniref:LysR family transcriptional regulator n=1 Tax=Kouleothrix aurantiaca TaxID=186479 RepID=A0A0N8PSR7_9CHLR|nr:LysR family transcriptional regulator [Kouleothrix aurantiaca]
MLNYHHLRYFWLVAHEGNITRAAQKHNIAQSALSMQINALEAYLGQALFERIGRRLVLTEAGAIALNFADAIFAKGDELLGTFGRLEAPQLSVLRVGALATLSRNFQLGFLRAPLAAPGVEVIIRSGSLDELLGGLRAYTLDVVLSDVAPLRDKTTRWVVHVIDEQPVSLVGQPHARRSEASLETLLRDETLVVPSLQSTIRMGFDALVNRMGLQVQIVAEVDDMAMLRLVAREHAGLSVVPSIVVKDELDSGALVEFVRLPGLAETFFAITMTRSFPNPLLSLVLPRYLPPDEPA